MTEHGAQPSWNMFTVSKRSLLRLQVATGRQAAAWIKRVQEGGESERSKVAEEIKAGEEEARKQAEAKAAEEEAK